MLRVLVAFLLACLAVQTSGCTGTIRLGNQVHADAILS